ncbi:MAG TPA: hypothetical protein VJL27_00905 [Patescibacteria group bacterium]|nr:hypothetical protein [Patescibacteria group bacterium]
MLKKARWLLIFGVIFSVAPVTKAAVFDSANLGYRKNILYNLRATVGNGSVAYGSYNHTLMIRPSGADGDKSDRLEINGTDQPTVSPANPSSGISPQTVMLQKFVSDNPMLINSHKEFEPSKSFGGIGYNLKTQVKVGDTLYAVNRLALLANPFIAIFGNIFAGQCTDSTNPDDTNAGSADNNCRKLNFGQKGIGTSANNLGGTNLQYQIPGYLIQSNSVLSWKSCDANTPLCNAVIQNIVDDAVARANCTINRRSVTTTNSTANNLGFKLISDNSTGSCRVEDLNSVGASEEGIVIIKNNQSTFTFTIKPSSGTLNLRDIGTVIVYGDIVVEGDTKYGSAADSIGFIALGKDGKGGTITIKSNASNIAGSFFAPGLNGKIIFEGGSNSLIAKGVFAATNFTLNKRIGLVPGSGPNGESLPSNYNVAILYDPRLQNNPPPGFKYGNVSILPSEQSLYEPAAP